MSTTMTAVSSPLHPGSTAAKAKGCSCSQIRNFFGRGHGGDGAARIYEVETDCLLHGRPSVPLGPIVCDACKEDMLAIPGKGFGCPNGCHGTAVQASTVRPAVAGEWACDRCRCVIARKPGRKPKYCQSCLTPAERSALEAKRAYNDAMRGGSR